MGAECVQQCQAQTEGGCKRDLFRQEGKNRNTLDLSDIVNKNSKEKRTSKKQPELDENQKFTQVKDIKQSMLLESKIKKEKEEKTIPKYQDSIIRKLDRSPEEIALEQSTFNFKSNMKYTGLSFQGLPHKQGVLTFYDGALLNSENFDHGHLSSEAFIRFIFPDKSKFEGEVSDGKANGHGTLIFTDGSFYEGDWQNDRPHGKGKHVISEEYFYQGDFEHGYKSGIGKYCTQDGSIYEGQFNNDQFHGQGVLTTFINRIYRGTWVNGLLQGEGEIDYEGGQKYRGEFKDGMRHGFGTYIYADIKRQWTGHWQQNRQHGKGKYTDEAGDEIEGEWVDGKKQEIDNKSFNLNLQKSQNKLNRSIADPMIIISSELQSKKDQLKDRM